MPRTRTTRSSKPRATKAAQAKRGPKGGKALAQADAYEHSEPKALLRPEVGIQAQFKKRKEPATYKFDSSLSPALEWDVAPVREQAEALIRQILDADDLAKAKAAAETLKQLSKPFLNWTGKGERLSFDVPTLPLFVHERLSTEAIIETLTGHKLDKQKTIFDLFGAAQHSLADQALKAYEYPDKWVNRMILGDSLVVMNSLLQFEGMGGQVQMIYMDPPYGVKFGSNFQPFVRQRSVSHGDDEDMTREPEVVQAYRDTWELGLHSYLTYLRDRLILSRELLAPSGSVFVQISDDNFHHVREVLDEVFGAENFVAVINFKTMMPLESGNIESVVDYLCWYAKDKERLKYRNLYTGKNVGKGSEFVFADTEDGGYRRLEPAEIDNFDETAQRLRIFKRSNLTSSGYTPSCTFPIQFEGQTFETRRGKSWRTTPTGVEVLKTKNRLFVLGSKLYYKMYLSDFGLNSLINQWTDTIEFGSRSYAVQTTPTVIQRCMLMTTDPGDLVVDPTCGSGTTAYVAEQWGRRWITCDTSRVPLALARQRLLSSTFDWYDLNNVERGPAGGFVFKPPNESKNPKSVGAGVIPHITLEAIANHETPKEVVLVDRPERTSSLVRVSGPFTVEATIPNVLDPTAPSQTAETTGETEATGTFQERMIEVLKKSPVLQLGENTSLTLRNVRIPARTLSLSAEAVVSEGGKKSNTRKLVNLDGKKTLPGMEDPARKNAIGFTEDKPSGNGGTDQLVALAFGPENGPVSEKLVFEAAREALAKNYTQLIVIGFAIQPNARVLIERCNEVVGIPAAYVQATTDILMGDLLKTTRASQIFSVCGLPDIAIRKAKTEKGKPQKYEVELVGLDTFDPVDMKPRSLKGDQVPAWLLDSDYNGMCFLVTQAFFPRTGAWDNLKKALKGTYDEGVWDHLAGTISAPFEAGEHKQIAVKVIDDRGNELLVVKKLEEAR